MDNLAVTIRGTGVAAYCSALLLRRAGVDVTLVESDRPRVPAIMIGEATQGLMRDVFQAPALFDGLHRITKRVVAWGRNAAPSALPHSAIVISEAQLAERLRPSAVTAQAPADTAPWTIYASRPLPPEAVEQRFGARSAKAAVVELAPQSDPATCWVESCANGWLFLIPHSSRQAYLLTVGEMTLEESVLIAPQIAAVEALGAEFPSYPRIVDPLCGDAWLACGTAAMAFDPICGDGTGNAVREAILAAAVIRASGPIADRLEHYRGRLVPGFLRHLDQCRQFYATGYEGSAWWREEHERIVQGMRWCQERLQVQGPFRYQLRDFDLERITAL